MIPIKSAKEIEKMRQSCRTASEILDRVTELIRPGVTTKEVDEAAADFMNEAKVKSAFLGYRLGHRVFPGNICISLNDEVVHGIGSQRRIQYGDIVKLDIGVIQDGWVGDTAQTVPVGVVDERTDQLLRVTEKALELAINVADEGRRLGDICAEIEDEAARNRFSVVREFVGHGVGRKLHEEPQIPNYGRRGSGPKLKAGMTLARKLRWPRYPPPFSNPIPSARNCDRRWTGSRAPWIICLTPQDWNRVCYNRSGNGATRENYSMKPLPMPASRRRQSRLPSPEICR